MKKVYYLIDIWDSNNHTVKYYFAEHNMLKELLGNKQPYDIEIDTLIKTLDTCISNERNKRAYFAISLINTSVDSHYEIDITRTMSHFSNSISKPNNATVKSIVMLYNYLSNKSLEDNEYFIELQDFDLKETILVNDEYIFTK